MNCVVLIFSKDRALQLDALLRSLLFFCDAPDSLQIRVLFTTSTFIHEKQYEKLKQDFVQYEFLQFIHEKNFFNDTITLLAPFDYVLFLTDDNIFICDFKIAEMIENIETHTNTIGFSLRLGKNTTYCYTLDKPQNLPEFQEIGSNILKFNWTHSEFDFGYPLELSSSLYRVQDILPFIAQLPFKNPNTLEALMDKNKNLFSKDKFFLLSYENSVAFCAPVNIVQTAWWNRSSTKSAYSPDSLAKLFDESKRIDVSAFYNFIPNACHQEIDLQFIDKAGKGGVSPVSKEQKLVSILILNYNGLNDIRACLDSIKRNTPENHEIIVIDNSSTDGSLEYLRSLSDITLVENPTNIGCPPARAQGLSLANGNYIILLDNDTIVTNGWVTKFIAHAEADSAIGIMGPRSNYVSGSQVVLNVPYRSISDLEEFANNFAQQNHGQLTPSIRLVGFCMFIRRAVIDKIGNIDASFGKFGFEDDDYTWRTNVAGFKTCIANDVFIHHTGGPQGRGDSQYNQLLLVAWEQYKRKWRLPEDLQYGYHCSPEILSKFLTQPFDRKRHYIPIPDLSSIEKLIYHPGQQFHPEIFTGTEKDKLPDRSTARVPALISIVILASESPSFLKECIDHVMKNTKEPYEMLIVPRDPVFVPYDWLSSLLQTNKNHTLMKKPIDSSYPNAFNTGITESSGECIVILNDDVLVTEGWLAGMIEHLNSAPDIGIVSPMTVNVDGLQGVRSIETGDRRLEIGKETETHGDSWRLFETIGQLEQYAEAFRERNSHRRMEATNLNGFCMLFTRELSKKVGLMDERIGIPDFADNDYCLRAAVEGYRNIIAGDVFVHSGRDRTLAKRQGEFGESLPAVSKLFFDKWNSIDVASPLGKKVFGLHITTGALDLRGRGRYDEAVKILLDSRVHLPDDKNVHYLLAELLIEQKRFSDAVNILESLPLTLRGDAETLSLIGYCNLSTDRIEEAGQFAGKALALNDTSPKALNLKGLVALKKNDFAEAETFFRKAIESDRSFGEAYANLGALRWKEGKKEEALSLFERAFILSPTIEEILDKYQDTVLSSLLKPEKAEQVIREASDLYPNHKRLQYALADLFLMQEKNHEALHVLVNTLLQCGADDDTLARAIRVRDLVGPKAIGKNIESSLLIADSSYEGKGAVEVEEKNKGKTKGKKQKKKKARKTQQTQQTQETKKAGQTISLCMIVKNEEQNIIRCLHKTGALVDEIIVVDTGSSDRTKDIAKAFGAKVFDFLWTNDFSAARNVSLSKATGDWILVLDADEVISTVDHNRLKELIRDSSLTSHPSSLRAYSFVTRNYVYPVRVDWVANNSQYLEEEAGTGWVPSKKVRLFPNNPRIRFQNPVHELVEDSLIQSGVKIVDADIPVHHYGKLQQEKITEKASEYYEMGKQKLEETSAGDINALYELAVQATELAKHDEAEGYWKKLIELHPDFAKAYIGLGDVYAELGRHGEAAASLKKAYVLEPESSSIATLYAKYALCAGDTETPLSVLDSLVKRDATYPPALGLLAAAYFCVKRTSEGLNYTEKLNRTNFNAAQFFTVFAKELQNASQIPFAIALLEAAVVSGNATEETHRLRKEITGTHRDLSRLAETKAKETSGDKIEIHRDSLSSSKSPNLKESQPACVSLCLIVKNEEENIERCLSSVTGLVNEIIVVDTGSTDRTKEIAQELGTKVYDFPWTDSFSDARNFSLSKATGKWILILDADEVISPTDHEALRELIYRDSSRQIETGRDKVETHGGSSSPASTSLNQSQPVSSHKTAYSFTTRNYVTELNTIDWVPNDGRYPEEAGIGWFPGEKVRLFPNLPELSFAYPVHERLEPSLSAQGIRIERCDVPIHHYGTLDREKEMSKAETYYALAVKKLDHRGVRDAATLYELAVQAAGIGKHKEALAYLTEVIAQKPGYARAYTSMGNNYFNLGRYSDARSSYQKAIERDPDSTDALLQNSLCEIYMDNAQAALPYLEGLLENDPAHLKALTFLTVAYFLTGRDLDGMKTLEQLNHLRFNSIPFLSGFAKSLLRSGNVHSALMLLETAAGIQAADEDIALLLSQCRIIKDMNSVNRKVSIIIPVSGPEGKTRQNIESIQRHTPEPHEILFVPASAEVAAEQWLADLAQKNAHYSLLDCVATASAQPSPKASLDSDGDREKDQVNTLSDSTVLHANAWNAGIKASSGEYIVLFDERVTVTEGWLSGMLECIMADPYSGIAGPMTVHIEGPQNVIAFHENPPDAMGDFAKSFRVKHRYRRIHQRKLSGVCMLLKRSVIEKIGLFDEQFTTLEYPSDDYCLRASLEGFGNLIAGDVFVHYTGDHSPVDPMKTREAIIAHNKRLFTDRKCYIDKWSSSDSLSPSGKELFAVNAFRFADDLRQKEEKQQAIAALLEGLMYAPESKKLHYALVDILIEEQNFKEAIEIIEKMPEALKQGAKTFELIGYCKEGLGLYDEAEQSADTAISVNGASPKAWNLKGIIAYKKGNLIEAEEFFSKAMDCDRSLGETYANLGALRWNTARKEEALDLFEKAFILSPTIENITVNFHAAAVSLARLDRAEEALKDASALYPANKKINHALVDVLLQREKYNEAMHVFREGMLAFGINNDTLALALGIREKIGPKEIGKLSNTAETGRDKSRQIETRGDSQSQYVSSLNVCPVSISLCMIVKNEEKNIARCLHSIDPLVDEMIVVDTGSSDRTKDIAKAFGAKVYDFKWTNDFSEARNYSLSKASGHWILVLDADEMIAPFDQDALKELLSLPAYKKSTAFTIGTRNYVLPVSTIGWRANDGSYIKEETGSGWFSSDKVRIFPNNPHVRFEFPVHEFVEMTLQKVGIRNTIIDIPIHHYGKLEKDKTLTKGEDYYILGKLKLDQRGEEDFIALYELAVQASELERFDEALDFWRRLNAVKPDFPKAYFGMANSYYRLGNFEDAFAAVEKVAQLEKNSDELREMAPLYAACALCVGKAEACIPLLEDILKRDPEFPMGTLMTAMAYCCANRKEEGQRYLARLRKMRLNYDSYLYEFAEFLLRAGSVNYGFSIIQSVLEFGTSDTRFSSLLAKYNESLENTEHGDL